MEKEPSYPGSYAVKRQVVREFLPITGLAATPVYGTLPVAAEVNIGASAINSQLTELAGLYNERGSDQRKLTGFEVGPLLLHGKEGDAVIANEMDVMLHSSLQGSFCEQW